MKSATRFWMCRTLLACTIAWIGALPARTEPSDLGDPEHLSRMLRAPEGLYQSVVAIITPSQRPPSESPMPRRHRCSGVVVAPLWVLTVGPCAPLQYKEDWMVLWGNTDLTKANGTRIVKVVRSIDGGVALLQLEVPVGAKPARITSNETIEAAMSAQQSGAGTVVGWGKFFQTERDIDLQFQRHLTVTLLKDCSEALWDDDDSFICAQSRFKAVNIDTCFGFAGAPLFVADKSASSGLSIVGLVRRGGQGCLADKAGVYVRLAADRAWIEETIAPRAGAISPQLARPRLQRVGQWTPPSEWSAAQPLAFFPGLTGIASAPQIDPLGRARQASAAELAARLVDPNPTIAADGLFRFVVSFGLAGAHPTESHFCGGVIVSRGWILTAGHCVAPVAEDSKSAKSIKVVIDRLRLSDSQRGKRVDIEKIVLHPGYKKTPFNFLMDVALVKVDSDAIPADLDALGVPDPATETKLRSRLDAGIVVGWGMNATSDFAHLSDYMHRAPVALVPDETCKSSDKYGNLIDSHMVCAGDEKGDSCQGDSGGPLLLYDPDAERYVLYGLVSWGAECASKKLPGVYTRVASFGDWIRQNAH